MIQYPRHHQTPAPVVKVLGLGGAGSNLLDRLILDGLDATAAVALNTDLQSLNASVAPDKIHLGRNTTRGLGAGGDPELGFHATEEASEEIAAVVTGADLLFLCAGLGGGTGSGGAPLIAHLARKAGAVVVAFVTLPFSFEGKRRRQQAAEALEQLQQQADLVLCFENDRMGEAVVPTAGVQQAFIAADQMLSQSLRAVGGCVQRRGPLPVALDDLAAALRQQHGRAHFGYGESDSANRAHEALERALKSPLMDKGRLLTDTPAVLIHIAGGPELTLNEVSILMEEFNRHISDTTRIHFGVSTDARLGKRLCVSILSSLPAIVPALVAVPEPAPVLQPATPPVARPEPAPKPTPAPAPAPVAVSPAPTAAPAEELFPAALTPKKLDTFTPPEPDPLDGLDLDEPEPDETPAPAAPRVAPAPAPAPAAKPAVVKKEEKAEQMSLEPANRGRFEKSEPTIVDGQDLDVPTFLRKHLKLK